MTRAELVSALRGLLDLEAITPRTAVQMLVSHCGVTRFAASLLLLTGATP